MTVICTACNGTGKDGRCSTCDGRGFNKEFQNRSVAERESAFRKEFEQKIRDLKRKEEHAEKKIRELRLTVQFFTIMVFHYQTPLRVLGELHQKERKHSRELEEKRVELLKHSRELEEKRVKLLLKERKLKRFSHQIFMYLAVFKETYKKFIRDIEKLHSMSEVLEDNRERMSH